MSSFGFREHATALPLPAPRHRCPQRQACLTSASSAPQPACALLYGMATSILGWLLSTSTSFALLASASPAPAQSQGGAGAVWGTLAKLNNVKADRSTQGGGRDSWQPRGRGAAVQRQEGRGWSQTAHLPATPITC